MTIKGRSKLEWQTDGLVPKFVFFTKGVGVHKEKLQSFELALRQAGVEKCNLVKVSSIYPPFCKIIPRAEGLKALKPGELVFCVLGSIATDEPYRLMSASIGLAVPSDKGHYGYLSEHEGYGQASKVASDYVEDLAATMLASTLGIDFDPNVSYDERKEVYKMSGKIVRSQSITQTAKGDAKGRWTTAIASAIFLLDKPIYS